MSDQYPKRINIELTNRCNLGCFTCMRHNWEEESLGEMEYDLAERLIDEAARMAQAPKVFFGGFGEPLTYDGIASLIGKAASAGCRTELISNGILLTKEMCMSLIESGLDMLWVSIDGATSESFADIRLGDHLPTILENLKRFRDTSYRRSRIDFGRRSELGFVTVLMKKNLHELPAIFDIARQLKVSRMVVSNIDPHDESTAEERLYTEEMYDGADVGPRVSIPRMDPSGEVLDTLGSLIRRGAQTDFGHMSYSSVSDLCPFVEERSVSVRWDGKVVPCLPLLHDHDSRINDHKRFVRAASFGKLGGKGNNRTLLDVWRDSEYVEFREKVDDFNFSPCTLCDSCDLAHGNEEDCFGNSHPTCGGCLWAQGFIRCP